MKKWHVGLRGFAVLLSALLVFPAGLIGAPSPPDATTEVEHETPGEKFIPGFRINLEATITDDAGLLANRCYFKTKNDKNFAFVDMLDKGEDLYQATLPAPFVNSEAVEYLFVVVNSNKQVTRTEMFMLEEGETKEAAEWKDIDEVREVRLDKVQDVAEKYVALYDNAKNGYAKNLPGYQAAAGGAAAGGAALSVKTELATSLVPVRGFVDAAMVTEVPAAAKFGFLAQNLYTADAIAAAGGASATGAVAGGTAAGTAAASGGLSTLAWVGIGAAAVGGTAVIASGGSSSSGGGTSTPTPTPTPGPTPTPTPAPTPTPTPAPTPTPTPVPDGDLQGQSGDVRVNLVWSGCNDLDLHVIDPCGNEIDFGDKSATCQGHTGTLDVDANAGACSTSPAENIVWPNSAPTGNYTVQVDYYDGTGSSSYSVVVINGSNRNTYSGTISSGSQTITTFSH